MSQNWKEYYKNTNKYYNSLKTLILDKSASSGLPSKEYKEFILNDTEHFVEGVLAIGITKTQLRNLFETFKACDSNSSLEMTRPKLLYTAGRLSSKAAKQFILNIAHLSHELKEEDDYKKVSKYIETVLAYHKYYAQN